ncbi:MAG: hypothetical protein ACLRVD_15995 [Blautia caecimuris]
MERVNYVEVIADMIRVKFQVVELNYAENKAADPGAGNSLGGDRWRRFTQRLCRRRYFRLIPATYKMKVPL